MASFVTVLAQVHLRSMRSCTSRHAKCRFSSSLTASKLPGESDSASSDERSGVKGIAFKGPMDEQLGQSYSAAVSQLWGNIPRHIRESFKSVKSVYDVPSPTATRVDSLVVQAKSLAATVGLAPAHWSGSPALYYQGAIPLVPYEKGKTAAYHYPKILIPREIALRIPMDMYVDPVFQTSDPALQFGMKGRPLFNSLRGKTTILVTFSGQPLSGLNTGVQRWLDACADQMQTLPNTQIVKVHAAEGWFSRRTHQLTKFHLRRQVEQNELFTTFVYRGKWKSEYVRNLHLYDHSLPSFLLVDGLGYIRWHAVGLPTEEATAVLHPLLRSLAREKKTHL